jgi:hypothetical protein
LTDTTASEQLDDAGALQPPGVPTAEQYEACRMALWRNVEACKANVLADISEQTEIDLVALAYHDVLRFERLERAIRDGIRDSQQGEAAAKRFNLNTFRKSAKQTRELVQEANSRRAKMRERNLRLIAGGKADAGTEITAPDGTKVSVEAAMEAKSGFLRAVGILQLYRPGRIWYDDFHGNFFTDWGGGSEEDVIDARPVSDAFNLRVYYWLQMLDSKLSSTGPKTIEAAIHFFGDTDHRNEPREWLQGLQWDGVPRLEDCLRYAYGVPDDAYHRAVGRCWFVSMVARIMQAGCKVDTMPVLIGPQGTSKSTSLEIIGGKWYAAITTSVSKAEDFKLSLLGVLVGEIAELDAISGVKVEQSRVKALLSIAEDKFRPPYGRTSQLFKRTVVFAGTTNEHGWHKDETGGRRFWPWICQGAIDLEWLRKFRDQLFAEAKARYDKGEKWWDVPSDDQNEHVMSHYTNDPWRDRIEVALKGWRIHDGWNGVAAIAGDPSEQEMEKHWGTLVTTNRLMTVALQIPAERQARNLSTRIARCMRELGWNYRSVRVKSGAETLITKAWVCNSTSEAGQLKIDDKLL